MKLYISADIEGTAGVMRWPETDPDSKFYPYFANEMTEEVRSACEGALSAGAEEIFVKDAHHHASNLNPALLPEQVRILRGWTSGPEVMMAGIEGGFGAAAMIGYHSSCASDGNPLAHTMNLENEWVAINGTVASEFMINAYTAACRGVPVVFVSGDKKLCESAKELIPEITAVAVSEGIGGASVSLQPKAAQRAIREGIVSALRKDAAACLPKLPEEFRVSIRYREAKKAYFASFYPGARKTGEKEVAFEAKDYFDVLRFFLFVL